MGYQQSNKEIKIEATLDATIDLQYMSSTLSNSKLFLAFDYFNQSQLFYKSVRYSSMLKLLCYLYFDFIL